MQKYKIFGAAVLAIVMVLSLTASGCFSGTGSNNNDPDSRATPVKPNPKVESVIETTSGTQNAYYATLDITVKNDGAEGIFLVVASVTQNGKTSRNEWPVYLKQGKSYEMKMTFPLTWKGGKWESNVQTVVP